MLSEGLYEPVFWLRSPIAAKLIDAFGVFLHRRCWWPTWLWSPRFMQKWNQVYVNIWNT